jgi:hypothetical protein
MLQERPVDVANASSRYETFLLYVAVILTHNSSSVDDQDCSIAT